MNNAANVVLSIDPGRLKCGVAVVKRSSASPEILHHCVADTVGLATLLKQLVSQFSPDTIIIGNGTSSRQMLKTIESLRLAPVVLVDEKYSTLLAKKRYFVENPPHGLRKLIPTSLQTPPRAYDDYVAVILAERYIEQ